MKDFGCSCDECKNCCWRSPGWFGSKGEVIGAAKIMNCSLREFANKYLVREWRGKDYIYVPAPIRNISRINEITKSHIDEMREKNLPCFYFEEIEKSSGGFKIATWGHNLVTGFACIFLNENNLCMIHESKPTECRETFGCSKKGKKKPRPEIADYWANHQDWIKENLGRKVNFKEKVRTGFVQMTDGKLPNREAFSIILLMGLIIMGITYII